MSRRPPSFLVGFSFQQSAQAEDAAVVPLGFSNPDSDHLN